MEDAQIVELYWNRDERAVTKTVERYGPYCRTVAGRILPDPGEAEECVSPSDSVEEEVQRKELEGAVRAFLRGLPTRDRDIFLRRYFFVEPVGEIAARYAMRENAVSAVLSRTRKKLRVHLEQEGWI